MNYLNRFGVVELSCSETIKTDGGILALVLAAAAVATATVTLGYTLGKDLYHVLND